MTTKLQPKNIHSLGWSCEPRSLPSSVLPSASITTVCSRLCELFFRCIGLKDSRALQGQRIAGRLYAARLACGAIA